MTIPLVAFVGRSGSGKTTLLVQIIQELCNRGYRVATIKHHGHGQVEVDQPGKDTWRFAQAGSSQVVLSATNVLASFQLVDDEPTLREIAHSITGVDLILVEGYKKERLPAVEVVRSATSTDIVGRDDSRIAVATDVPLDLGAPPFLDVPQFDLDDVAGLADLIESHFLSPQQAPDSASDTAVQIGSRPGDELVRTSYQDALQLTLQQVTPLGTESANLEQSVGRVLAHDLYARVDSPSVDCSLKDGYAVLADDTRCAAPDHPAHLPLVGRAAAGQPWLKDLQPGNAVRILTGAALPLGTTAVVPDELASDDSTVVTICSEVFPGDDVQTRGSNITTGDPIAQSGQRLHPSLIGLLAAAGHSEIPVYARPRIGLLSTGDEVVAPGKPLSSGQLYASNLASMAAWCARYGFETSSAIVPDRDDAIRDQLLAMVESHDAILTSGGAWRSERDLVVRLLDELGWHKVYHRVRMGPGKGVGFGIWRCRPVFCLPGGPPSNQMAFLQLALPGLMQLAGSSNPRLPVTAARLAAPLHGGRDWTKFVHGDLSIDSAGLVFSPAVRVGQKSRLREMASSDAIASVPEGEEAVPAGAVVVVQLLRDSAGGTLLAQDFAASRECND